MLNTQKLNKILIISVAVLAVFFMRFSFAYAFSLETVRNFPRDIIKNENTPNTEAERPEFVKEPFSTAQLVGGDSYYVNPVPPRHAREVVVASSRVPISAYSSTPDQTDGSPFITASGTRTRDGVVAANHLPIGTKIKIPAYFGDKVFTVEDRMNRRYWRKVDIWMPTRGAALQWGVRYAEVEVVKEI